MKDVDGLFYHIDHRIHRYLFQVNHMRTNNIAICQFAYSNDLFPTCSNPRRVTTSTNLSAPLSSFIFPLLPIFRHSLTLFVFNYFLRSSSISKSTPTTSYIIAPP